MTDKAKGRATAPTDDLWAIAKRAEAGDLDAVKALESAKGERHEQWLALYRPLANRAEEMLITAVAKTDPEHWALLERLLLTGNELAGPRPTPIVRAAARRAALNGMEADYASLLAYGSLTKKELYPKHVAQWVEASDRRYRASLKTLAELQRRPPRRLQFNGGTQQINVGDQQIIAGAMQVGSPSEVLSLN